MAIVSKNIVATGILPWLYTFEFDPGGLIMFSVLCGKEDDQHPRKPLGPSFYVSVGPRIYERVLPQGREALLG